MDLGLKGKRALVCGGSKGLGGATADALISEGADVFIIARDEVALRLKCEELNAQGQGKAFFGACDLLDHSSRQEVCQTAFETLGGVDILIHNVGGPKASYAEETGLAEWQSGFDRLFAPIIDLNAQILPQMKLKGWGRIVVITSLSVLEPIAMLSISNVMRSSATAFSKTLADEVARHGITVNCVAPGMVQTDRTEELLTARSHKSGKCKDEYLADFLQEIPARRLGRPLEFGSVVCFLCSEQASYITGSTICVDGGKRKSTY